jgi:tagatose 6-phosphate kinase
MILSVCPNPSIDAYAWLESFEVGQANRIADIKEFPGGKGIHVAMAIKELGGSASIFANWAGANGEWIKKAPQLADIASTGIEIKGNNRKCYTFRSADKSLNNTELLEPGPILTTSDWERFLARFGISVKSCNLVCMSGSLPVGAPDNAYWQLLKICEKEGKKAILDCSGLQLEHALKTNFFGLHINEHEANSVFGTKNSLEIRNHLKGKVSLIAITKGKEGLFLYSDAHTIHANVKIDEVKSTVGSGDCLTAGIAFAVEKGLSLIETARYGVACGAANCLNEDLGILKIKDVANLLPKIKLAMNPPF